MTRLYEAYTLNQRRTIQRADVVISLPGPVDWGRTIDRLVGAGWTLSSIAEVCGVSVPSVQGWRKSSIPNFEFGRRFLLLCESAGIPVATSKEDGVKNVHDPQARKVR
jgi:hypothetical protein